MEIIKIKIKDHWSFSFGIGDEDILCERNLRCTYCLNVALDQAYSYIIERLDEAGLLPDDFKPACCYCYVLERFGLLDLGKKLRGFVYSKEYDILYVLLSFNKIEKNYMSAVDSEIRIHDYSKWA